LPRSGKPSPEFFFHNSPVVRFVELRIYNTVVLGEYFRNFNLSNCANSYAENLRAFVQGDNSRLINQIVGDANAL
jgi:hypothetical protein